MPPRSAYPSAALHSAGPRVSEVMGGKRERKEMENEKKGRQNRGGGGGMNETSVTRAQCCAR